MVGGGRAGDGEKTAAVVSAVSKSRICSREAGLSQAGGWMFARPCFLRSRASQRGRGVGKGGLRGWVGPCGVGRRLLVGVSWLGGHVRFSLTHSVHACEAFRLDGGYYSHPRVRGLRGAGVG